MLGAFLSQFYDDKPCPKLILLSEGIEDQELLGEALSSRAGYRVHVNVPQRGEKKELTDHALTNAREALGRRLAKHHRKHVCSKDWPKLSNCPRFPVVSKFMITRTSWERMLSAV